MKKRWILLIVILAVSIGGYLYLRIRKTDDFEPQIKAKLAKLVTDASNGLYKLDLDHIEIDVTSGSVSARNILLLPDSVRLLQLEKASLLGNDIYTISLRKLDLEGLSPLALLDKKNISLDKIILDSPEIKIVHKKRVFEKKDTGNLYSRIAKENQSYSIGNLLLKNIRLTIVNLDKNKTVSSFKNLSASFTDIKVDSSTANDSTRFLFAKDAVLFLKGFSQVTAKKKYRFDIDSVALRPVSGNMEFFDLKLKPEGTKDAVNAKLQHQEDMYDIHLKKGTINNMNWFSLLSEDGFYGDEMAVTDGRIKIYHDRSLPDGPAKKNNFPHQQLLGVNFPVSLKKISLKNVSLSYEELNPKSEHTGIVEFHNADGEITNLTNIPEEIQANPFTTLKASALFMNQGKLDAVFRFDLPNAAKGNFTVDAELGQMEGHQLNKITEGLALIKIKSLSIDKLKLHIEGNNNRGKGNVAFMYHDLAFDVLKNDEDEGKLKKRGLFSFIANTFIVNKANPSKAGAKPKEFFNVIHLHEPTRSFFNLIWKTLLEGILKTVK